MESSRNHQPPQALARRAGVPAGFSGRPHPIAARHHTPSEVEIHIRVASVTDRGAMSPHEFLRRVPALAVTKPRSPEEPLPRASVKTTTGMCTPSYDSVCQGECTCVWNRLRLGLPLHPMTRSCTHGPCLTGADTGPVRRGLPTSRSRVRLRGREAAPEGSDRPTR
jgi:hypothetical protein